MNDVVVDFFAKLNAQVCPNYIRRELSRRAAEHMASTTSTPGEPIPEIMITVTVDAKGNIIK